MVPSARPEHSIDVGGFGHEAPQIWTSPMHCPLGFKEYGTPSLLRMIIYSGEKSHESLRVKTSSRIYTVKHNE